MFLWLVLFILGLRSLIASQYLVYKAASDAARNAALQSSPQVLGDYAEQLTITFPLVALVCGLLIVMFPRLRARYIERRDNLATPPLLKSLAEICGYVERHAPGLAVKANLSRPGLLYIYPSGFRRATLAVFGGFVILWKTDREAAEAVLLHESAHQRRGDALFMGPGGLLETSVKVAVLLFVGLSLLPGVILSATYVFENSRLMLQLRELQLSNGEAAAVDFRPLSSLLWAFVMLLFSALLGLLLKSMGFATMVLMTFAQPLAAMWAAELNEECA